MGKLGLLCLSCCQSQAEQPPRLPGHGICRRCPRRRPGKCLRWGSAEHDGVIGGAHLAGGAEGRHEAVGGAKAGHEQGLDGVAVQGIEVAHGAQGGAEGEVGVDGPRDVLRDAHGGGDNEKRELRVPW